MNGSGTGFMHFLVLMGIIILIYYFLLIRPQVNKQKQQRDLLQSLKKGDKVVTSGGIHGVITKVKNGVVVLQVAENVRIEVTKSAVTSLKSREEQPSREIPS